jgi:hypothetical protein
MDMAQSAMHRLRRSRPLRVLLAASVLGLACPPPARAQGTATPAVEVGSSLQQARELIKTGEYDGAIEILKAAIARPGNRVDDLRDAYLLLVKTYVFLGNDLKRKPQGLEASKLNYKAARELVIECLKIRELRHTRPEPATDYPPEMISLFAEVRGQIFGSIRLVGLDPPDATALLDADTLRTLPADSLLGDVDVAVGPHRVTVGREGYKDATHEIMISPNSTLEPSYRLEKKRSGTWYAAVGAGAAGAVVAIFVLGQINHGSAAPPTDPPLPEAPPPPSGP